MGVFRINKTSDYTVMSNTHLRDKDLSLKAKGLLSVMLSLPDDWDYSIAGLAVVCNTTENKINSILKELKENNYLVIKKKYPDKTKSGRIEYIYDVYEKKTRPKKTSLEKTSLEKTRVEKTSLEKIGTNKILNKQNTDNNKILSESNTPTLEQVKEYCKKEGLIIDAKAFYYHYQSTGWKGITDWKAKAQSWNVKDKEKLKKQGVISRPPTYDMEEIKKTIINNTEI